MLCPENGFAKKYNPFSGKIQSFSFRMNLRFVLKGPTALLKRKK